MKVDRATFRSILRQLLFFKLITTAFRATNQIFFYHLTFRGVTSLRRNVSIFFHKGTAQHFRRFSRIKKSNATRGSASSKFQIYTDSHAADESVFIGGEVGYWCACSTIPRPQPITSQMPFLTL